MKTNPVWQKQYRMYTSRKANVYKKYYQNVRKSVENEEYSSVAAHKQHLTKRLDRLSRMFQSVTYAL